MGLHHICNCNNQQSFYKNGVEWCDNCGGYIDRENQDILNDFKEYKEKFKFIGI